MAFMKLLNELTTLRYQNYQHLIVCFKWPYTESVEDALDASDLIKSAILSNDLNHYLIALSNR